MKTSWWNSLQTYIASAMMVTLLTGCRGSKQLAEEYDTLPKLREYTAPVYPEKISLPVEDVVVLLNLRIDKEGNVRSIWIARSSGEDELDTAACIAARTWKYYPASKDGKPLPIVIQQKVVFSTKLLETVSFYEIVVGQKELADSLWNLLESGTDFSEVAVKFSEAASATQGGLRETVRYDTLPTVVSSALQRLGPSQFSRPLQLPDKRFMIAKRKKA